MFLFVQVDLNKILVWYLVGQVKHFFSSTNIFEQFVIVLHNKQKISEQICKTKRTFSWEMLPTLGTPNFIYLEVHILIFFIILTKKLKYFLFIIGRNCYHLQTIYCELGSGCN